MTTDILAAIDGALSDWDTSEDAMRWQPDPARVICDGGRALWPERYSVLRHGTYYYSVMAVGAGGEPVPVTSIEFTDRAPVLDPAAMPGLDFIRETLASFALFGEAYIRAAGPLVEAFSAAGDQVLELGHRLGLDTAKAFGIRPSLVGIGGHEHSPARCRTCNPDGNPLPLAINGSDYRCRQRNRRKRGR